MSQKAKQLSYVHAFPFRLGSIASSFDRPFALAAQRVGSACMESSTMIACLDPAAVQDGAGKPFSSNQAFDGLTILKCKNEENSV
jgi:hypothetical protein